MKERIFKYLFFMIVILLILISIYYILYKDKKEKINATTANKVSLNISKEINIGITKFDTINPILSKNRDVQYVDKLIFKSLLDISYDFKIENLLAKEFSKLNSTTYLLKLQDNLYWHDGTKITAKDVIFTVNSLKKERINSIYKENVANIDRMEELDDLTIKIFLNKEDTFFEYKMCFPILANHAYDENTLNSKTKIPIGSGKYKIESIQEDKIKIIAKDTNDNLKIRKISIILEKSIKDLYNSFSKNEIDYIITDNIEYEKYIGTMGYNVKQAPNRKYDYLAINCKKETLKNKEIRQAINYAIDRNSINYNVFNNKYNISNFPLDYGNYLYDKEKEEYNINKAKTILRENGWNLKNNYWVKNNKRLEFNIVVNKNNENRILIAKEIKEQLNKVGIIINLIQVNDYQYNYYLKNKNYDIILTGNIISNNSNLETYFGDNNLSNYYNNEINTILEDIKNIEDKEIIKEKYLNIKEIYEQEMPFISLYFNSLFVLSNTNLKGDLSFNWHNLFYNIENWYKIENNY